MFRRKVTGPDGRKWTLGRRWLPRYRKLGRTDVPDMPGDGLDLGGDDLGIFGAILLAIIGIFVAIVLVLVLFNVVAIAIELMLFVTLAVAGLIGRVVFRRPWIVFARSGENRFEYPVVGYFNSRRKLQDLASQLSIGAELEPAAGDGR
jgi:hypothetical protein